LARKITVCEPNKHSIFRKLRVPAANLVRGGSPDEKRQNRFNLVLFIGRAADRARAAGSDVAIEALRAAIAESVPENIRWESLRETLKEEGL
jgi:hypothetical protein